MVVALLLFSVIGGGIMTVITRQQRFYRSAAEAMKLQRELRQGASVLPLDIRALSTSDTLVNASGTRFDADVYSRSDRHLEIRRVFGSSLLCARRSVAPLDTITLYPRLTAGAAALSSWGIAPVAGDSALILDEGALVGESDDRWVAYEVRNIQSATGPNGCPWKTAADPSPVLDLSDTARASFKVALDRPLSTTVLAGAPVRFFRRVRYEIYQAADRQWYLGYSDCVSTYSTVGRCSAVTPVSGPYLPFTGIATENGLTFAYYDASGNALATSAQSRLISRIDVVMRSQTKNNVTRTGSGTGAPVRDSLVLSIAIRNRR
jgi:hypothetical protein